MGPGGPHRILDSDHPPAFADRRFQAAVLGRENGVGALAVRTDRDRQARLCRDDRDSSGSPGAGGRPADTVHLDLREKFQPGEPAEQTGEQAEGGREEERRVKIGVLGRGG